VAEELRARGRIDTGFRDLLIVAVLLSIKRNSELAGFGFGQL
jgi:hypothetical protein